VRLDRMCVIVKLFLSAKPCHYAVFVVSRNVLGLMLATAVSIALVSRLLSLLLNDVNNKGWRYLRSVWAAHPSGRRAGEGLPLRRAEKR
jgi:hypothetical protein